MLTSRCLLLVVIAGFTDQAMAQSKDIAVGAWSKPVTDNQGAAVRGRLVVAEKQRGDDRREVAVYVELQDASQAVGRSMQLFCEMGRTDFRPEYKAGLHCEMHDKDKRSIASTGFPFSGAVPRSQWITLPSDGTIRLRASPWGIHRSKAMAIVPQLNQLWVIGEDDANEYFLSGTFTIDPSKERTPPDDGYVWRGTIVLPAVRMANRR